MGNERRLKALRALIDEEGPVDGIHNEDIAKLYECGGSCPRYLGCTSEGSSESTYRHNPDFFAGEPREMGEWLAASYVEGWAANWVADLDDPRAPSWRARLDWSVLVAVRADSAIPQMVDTLALTGAANDALVAYVERLRRADARGRLREEIGVGVPVELAVEIVNRALGRGPDEIESTRRLVGLGQPDKAAGLSALTERSTGRGATAGHRRRVKRGGR